MNEMVERVARALREEARVVGVNSWDEMEESRKEKWRWSARAAIEAMREPTPGMESTAFDLRACTDDGCDPSGPAYWRRMIDEALRDGE